MARPPTPKDRVSRDHSRQMLDLFGTKRNAYSKLRLDREMTWQQFRNALNRQAEPDIVNAIEDSWKTYRAPLLRAGLRIADGFALPDDPTN